ncbi:MAG: ATP-binding cassette domain-containing protein [Eubacteriales bacterium]|nr:ATP-binding cassette domain-containing protein [Eubacteriales bacterium]
MRENDFYVSVIDWNGHIQEFEIPAGSRSIKLGRDARMNTVLLPFQFVSGSHGEIIFEKDRIFYVDLNSANGTEVECDGMLSFLFHTKQKADIRDGSLLRIRGSRDQEGITILFYSKQDHATWKKIPVGKAPITIGRSHRNDIVLKNSSVSREHAVIQEKNGICTIRNLKSTNGLLVNGRAVREEKALKAQDVIEILDHRIIFSGHLLFYKNSTRGVTLETQNLRKVVGKQKKVILNNVNCRIDSNEFVAIIGGSGAGKTTLMNAMGGFDRDIQGTVLCNGMDLRKQFQHLKSIIGYVPQQDIIYENLTLRKMLYYTAKLKMPKDTSMQEIDQKINEVLEMVELTEHQNTYIRKLSGGQKKRASIAVELLADPKLFFLDEPTSGLDPGTEKNLMAILSKLSKTKDKTIIMVTHTTQSLDMCDRILFMGEGGRLCFAGTPEQALMFFDTDSLVDIYNMVAENPALWEEQFAHCMEQTAAKEPENSGREELKKRKTSLFYQLFYLSLRYAELIKNDLLRLALIVLQPLIIGILLYIVSDEDIFDIYESTKSMMFALSCSGIWMGLFNSIQEICKERVIIKREYMANLKLPAYILSKIIVQSAIGFLQALILTVVFLTAVGKSGAGILTGHFHIEIFMTVWLTILASMAIGFIVSSIVKTGDKAMAVAPFILIVQLLFSGILFTLEGLGEWISYLTISRWSVEALGSIVNLNAMQLRMQKEIPSLEHAAEDFFKFSAGHLWKAWGILFIMMVVFSAVSTLLLRNVARDSR